MPYTSNIPQANDQLSVSQGQILTNFTALGAIAGKAATVGSASLNATAGFNFVNFAPNNPNPSIALNNIALFNGVAAPGNTNELWYYSTNTTYSYPITNSILSTNGNPGLSSDGWAYLPSGILVKWGQVRGPGTFNFPGGAAPAFTVNPFMAYLQLYNANINGTVPYYGTLTTTQIQIVGVAALQYVNYLVIGA